MSAFVVKAGNRDLNTPRQLMTSSGYFHMSERITPIGARGHWGFLAPLLSVVSEK
jgi:hypothetical protein